MPVVTKWPQDSSKEVSPALPLRNPLCRRCFLGHMFLAITWLFFDSISLALGMWEGLVDGDHIE